MSEAESFFTDAEAYELAIGRWSRVAGGIFLDWLSLPDGLRWLDVGCGTGSFTELVVDGCAPSAISAIDPSEQQIALAIGKPGASRVDYRQGDAMALPFGDGEFDVAVMALVIQYVDNRTTAMAEMKRVVRPGGTVAAYVWPKDEGHPQQPLTEALESMGVEPRRTPGDRVRPIGALMDLFDASGLEDIDGRGIEFQLTFENFDDYWASQTAQASKRSFGKFTDTDVERLKDSLRNTLPTAADGGVAYKARASAVKGRVPA